MQKDIFNADHKRCSKVLIQRDVVYNDNSMCGVE